ncbi:MAG: YggU family protein [Chloroflexi bacterium RBG_13_51_52]|nr:MAG: YggU family protein [Chloroflexi bacterium RBG_13_51_52]
MSANKESPGIRLAVRVTPNAGRNEITDLKDGVLYIKIAAPPEKGKANKELIGFLAERMGIKKASLLIIKGQTSRNKVISIQGMSNEELLKRI